MKQKRDQLKTYFVTNNIPTQGNFYDVIESGLNQNEDGITKLDSGPIALQSQGTQNEILHLYKTQIDPGQAPDWKIKLSSSTPSDLGIYNTAANIDTSRLFIKADGNVGIGTLTPSARLEVSGMLKATVIQPSTGNTVANGILFPNDPAGGGGDAAWMRYYARTDTNNKLLPDSTVLEIGTSNDPDDHIALMPSGNVGIGTINPTQKLDVNGTVNAVRFIGDGSGLTNLANVVNLTSNQTVAGIKTFSSTVIASGNVGIGIIPSSPLSFSNTVGEKIALYGAGDAVSGFGIQGNLLQIHSDVPSSDIAFGYGSSAKLIESMRIKGNGNVGIGTSNPSAKLDVNGMLKATIIQPSIGNTVANGILFPNDPAGGGGDAAWIRYYARTDANNKVIADNTILEIGTSNDTDDHIALMPSGNVGIGTITPVAKLDVFGSARLDYGPYVYLTYSNILTAATGGFARSNIPISIKASDRIVAPEFNANSDARIKKGFTGIDAAANFKKINQLAVTEFCYKDEIKCGNAIQTGFIAQEVEKVIPEAVSTHTDFIPDVYALSSSASLDGNVLTITMKENHGLQSGDTVRLINSSETKEVNIIKVDGQTFTVYNWKGNDDNIFVYGKKVNDFRTVNYNCIFSLGISAIQELYKQVQQLKEELSEVTGRLTGKLTVG